MLARQVSPVPTRKTTASVIAGAVTTVILYVLNAFVLSEPLPHDVAAAVGSLITTVVVAITGYLVSPSAQDGIVIPMDGARR